MCPLCGGSLTDDLCMVCLTAIDDETHVAILATPDQGFSDDELQRMQFRSSLQRYFRAVEEEAGWG